MSKVSTVESGSRSGSGSKSDLRAVGINPNLMTDAWDGGESYLEYLGIRHIGQQERLNSYPLDAFNDVATGMIFLRKPFESVGDMVRRIRARGSSR